MLILKKTADEEHPQKQKMQEKLKSKEAKAPTRAALHNVTPLGFTLTLPPLYAHLSALFYVAVAVGIEQLDQVGNLRFKLLARVCVGHKHTVG